MNTYYVCLSYDLGFEDEAKRLTDEHYAQEYHKRHQVLAEWLESKHANECGYSVAEFLFRALLDVSVENELRTEIMEAFLDGGIKTMDGMRVFALIATTRQLEDGRFTPDKVLKHHFIIGERN